MFLLIIIFDGRRVMLKGNFPVTITHKPHSTWGKTTNTNDINGRLGLGGSHKMAAVLRGATRRSPRAAGGQRLLRASPRGGDAAPFFCSARWGDEWGESPPWERDVQVSFPERSSLICCIFFFLQLVMVSVLCIDTVRILHSSCVFVPFVGALISITTCLAVFYSRCIWRRRFLYAEPNGFA